MGDLDDSQLGSIGAGRSPKPVNQSRVRAKPRGVSSYTGRQYECQPRTYGKRGPSLAATWYQSERVITVDSEWVDEIQISMPMDKCSPLSTSYRCL